MPVLVITAAPATVSDFYMSQVAHARCTLRVAQVAEAPVDEGRSATNGNASNNMLNEGDLQPKKGIVRYNLGFKSLLAIFDK